MFKLINSIKSNIKSISLSVINITLTTITLIYLISIHGFDHINKEFIINFIIGVGGILFIVLVTALIISFTLYGAFKIAAKKLTNNLDSILKIIQDSKDKTQEHR